MARRTFVCRAVSLALVSPERRDSIRFIWIAYLSPSASIGIDTERTTSISAIFLPSRRPPRPQGLTSYLRRRSLAPDMCHRRLHFYKSTACGHLTLTRQQNIDCRRHDCVLSVSHSCSEPVCRCRRYYTQPERIVEQELPGNCPRCGP